jgi:hypothetical protein
VDDGVDKEVVSFPRADKTTPTAIATAVAMSTSPNETIQRILRLVEDGSTVSARGIVPRINNCSTTAFEGTVVASMGRLVFVVGFEAFLFVYD